MFQFKHHVLIIVYIILFALVFLHCCQPVGVQRSNPVLSQPHTRSSLCCSTWLHPSSSCTIYCVDLHNIVSKAQNLGGRNFGLVMWTAIISFLLPKFVLFSIYDTYYHVLWCVVIRVHSAQHRKFSAMCIG